MSSTAVGSQRFTGPIIIGGVGGGGTRVYKAIAQLAGFEMLVAPLPLRVLRPNQHDNLLMMKLFYPRWSAAYLKEELGAWERVRMRAECRLWLWLCGPSRYNRAGIRWGWKNPNTAFLIPFFRQLYPGMRYIHVVRDGRDHAFHPRFPYLRYHHRLMYSEAELQLPEHLRKALFWSRCNRLIETAAAEHLGPENYLVSRLEDLCDDPHAEVGRILEFLGIPDTTALAEAAALVRVPASFSRWREETAEQVTGVESLIGEDLVRYGYELSSLSAENVGSA